mgnify:CR=1 FL=1
MTVRAKKHLGQHFLKDEDTAKNIADSLTEVGYDNIQAVQVKKADEAETGSNFLYYLMAIELIAVVAFTVLLG